MSMIDKLKYFLGLEIKQSNNGVFVNKSKYCKDLLKIFDMDTYKEISTPMRSSTYVDQEESNVPVDITKY